MLLRRNVYLTYRCIKCISAFMLRGLWMLALTLIVSEPTYSQQTFPRTIYLIRHGAYDIEPDSQEESDPGLSPLGIAQARLVAARLRGLPVVFGSVTTSTMERAEQTAAAIHALLPEVRLEESASLRECTPPWHSGSKKKASRDETACADTLDSVFKERFRSADKAAVNDIIVAHGNVIRYLVTKAMGVSSLSWIRMAIAHASLTVVRIDENGRASVVSVGDVGHIPANLQSWGTPEDPRLVSTELASR